ncbi:envelope stress response membrane protein PspC [Vibrio ulleungensis]|jgi:phage shock protein C|uniref:Envelope stress response membrane protein PspC n=1 Tax=Vibrio ulleungensis TaxID=2807619 RepID=A0ABS2HL19_9VIBR|nr:envelope stress response membrane protein PspC [Vibrio ulleungensis]MBM7036893.1 envelope stress response membrane protein PspC [Vibrio ulleungensis]
MRKQLYRDPANGKLTGVCAGIANYFEVEYWVVRILVVSATLLGGGFLIILAYAAFTFLLDKQDVRDVHTYQQKAKHSVKAKPWSAGESAHSVLDHVEDDIYQVEKRIREMEAHVTSESFKVNRAFKQL